MELPRVYCFCCPWATAEGRIPRQTSARKTPARSINRPSKTRRLKNPPSPTNLRVELRRLDRLWRAGVDCEADFFFRGAMMWMELDGQRPNVSCAIAASGRQLTPNAAKTTNPAKACRLEKAFRETDPGFMRHPLFFGQKVLPPRAIAKAPSPSTRGRPHTGGQPVRSPAKAVRIAIFLNFWRLDLGNFPTDFEIKRRV